MRNAIVTFTLVAGLAARAAAEPPPIPHDEGEPHRGVLDVGPWVPIYMIGHYSGVAPGVRAAGWLRRGAWAFGVEGAGGRLFADHNNTDGTPDPLPSIHGYLGRIGANARWQARVMDDSELAIDLWLQGGAGVHAVAWDLGGRLVRPDGQVGLGVTERIGRRRKYSVDVGVILVVGPGRSGGTPTCAGPCDEPTPPVRGGDFEVMDHIAFTESW
jgi:hypothetical protein